MITKFNSASPAGFSRSGDFTLGVPAWWVTIGNEFSSNEFRLLDGDYIIRDDNGVPTRYIPAVSYAVDLVVQNIVREEVGEELNRAIVAYIRGSALTNTQKWGVFSILADSVTVIMVGDVQAGRFGANQIGTNANFTAQVKADILAIMDAAIAKL